ncbi:hypothetical protein EYF80_065493 [Liparis tanakae]|uniref:Uncharacterized protein n=1 Tax=Liparis tanakae TaxID=230148 RepID=A0A4Z2E6V7_9TELE|nr:hypothetical protein EYF80_065493 [Liparis tanakae]
MSRCPCFCIKGHRQASRGRCGTRRTLRRVSAALHDVISASSLTLTDRSKTGRMKLWVSKYGNDTKTEKQNRDPAALISRSRGPGGRWGHGVTGGPPSSSEELDRPQGPDHLRPATTRLQTGSDPQNP